MTVKQTLGLCLAALPLMVISFLYFDQPLAVYFHTHFLRDGSHFLIPFEIPDLLLPVVCVSTVAAWLAFFIFKTHAGHNLGLRLSIMLGTSVPLAFILKGVGKFMVGRINTRVWLDHPSAPHFRGMSGLGSYASFPSGHMAVFTVMAAAVAACYPRWRGLCAAALVFLGFAMLVTNNHFLSDILAGTGLGLIIHAAVCARLGVKPV